MTIHFTRYVHSKSIKIFSLHYHELMRKNEEHKGKKYLTVDDYISDKVLDKIKEKVKIVNLMILRFWLIQIINCQAILLWKMLWY